MLTWLCVEEDVDLQMLLFFPDPSNLFQFRYVYHVYVMLKSFIIMNSY